MTERAYYSVKLTALTRKKRLATMAALGDPNSKFAHERPRISVAPNGKTAIVRVHWSQNDAKARASWEKPSHVSVIDRLESAAIKRSWSEAA